MWDLKQKSTNKLTNSLTQKIVWCLPEEKGGNERMKKIKGTIYMLKEGDWAFGSEHTTRYTEVVLDNCTPETYHVIN